MPVEIHGKQYVTVAERVAGLHEARNGDQVHVDTWIVNEDDACITMGARVTTPAGTFTGHARSDKTTRSIEGQSPLEVAETSAVGRALGFAGFGVVEGIASADEVHAAQPKPKQDTPEKAAMRRLRAVATEKGLDEAALKLRLQTDSVKALAEHMVGPKGDCEMPHPHNLPDTAAAYRVFTEWAGALVSKAQLAMLTQIADYWRAHGYAPSVRDLVAARGFASTGGVAPTLSRLRDQGLVAWEPRTNRTLRLTSAGKRVLGE